MSGQTGSSSGHQHSDNFNNTAYVCSKIASIAQEMPEQSLRFTLDQFIVDAWQGKLGQRMKDYAVRAFEPTQPGQPVFSEENADGNALRNVLRFMVAKCEIFAKSLDRTVSQTTDLENTVKAQSLELQTEKEKVGMLREYIVNDVFLHFGTTQPIGDEIRTYLGGRGLDDGLIEHVTRTVLARWRGEVLRPRDLSD